MSCWRRHQVVRQSLQYFLSPLHGETSCRTSSIGGLLSSRSRSFSTSSARSSAPRREKKQPLQPGAAGLEVNRKLPILQSTPLGALQRRNDPQRTGVIAYKKGMTALFDENTGKRLACTILQLDRVQVTMTKTAKEHGYWAVQVGSGWRKPKNVGRAMMGHYAQCEVSPKEHLVEFRVKDEKGLLAPGTILNADWFMVGQAVDVRAKCKGKGFAGGMKRHGFSGQPATHGNSLSHRVMGSAGQSQGGGSRVLPGKRMAGRMGGQRVTNQNVKVLKVDTELNVVIVKGAVPGPKHAVVRIQDAHWQPPAESGIEYQQVLKRMKSAKAIPLVA